MSEATENPENSGEEEAISEDDWAAAMAEQAIADSVGDSANGGDSAASAAASSHVFQDFGADNAKGSVMNELDVILDIPVQITVELGRTKLTIKNLLQLAHGSVVELDAMAGEPLDVLVNGTLIAQGEVVVVNEKFGIRLTDIITPAERMRKIAR